MTAWPGNDDNFGEEDKFLEEINWNVFSEFETFF